MPKDQEYLPLTTRDPDELDHVTLRVPKKSAWTFRFSHTMVLTVLLAAETLAFAITIFMFITGTRHTTYTVPVDRHRILYSPALPAVEHEIRVFNSGFGVGISRITREEASRLPNKTHAIPGDEGHYIIGLDVFHSLHCLNQVRMALDPDYYPEMRISTTNNRVPEQEDITKHIGHCVDWLRQSIMCTGDTSVIVWQWHDSSNSSGPSAEIAHTCRKFDKLQDWGKEHAMKVHYDSTVRIDDDIAPPIFHNEIR
ncbi:hypothetical protein B0H11DRAFT_2268125 [Mycena galericulata]|nr:hypothetical protein B0H11DRAFT_2268125 [Mycena galericulata]